MTIESGAGSRSKLPWTGLLSRAQLNKLKEEVPNFVICPGYTSRFGTKADEAGKVYVAGATSSYSHAKSTFLRWAAKDTESVKWWLEFVKEKGIEPITAHDVLDGLEFARWEAYEKAYKRGLGALRVRQHHARKKTRVIAEKEEDHGVARDLLGLAAQAAPAAGPSASSSSSSSSMATRSSSRRRGGASGSK